MPLRDVLPQRPRILFVGINPGLESERIGHHFGHKANPFWRLLHTAGLTPVQLAPSEDQRLAEFGLGLTNLCPRCTKTASELGRAEIAAGRQALDEKIHVVQPGLVAFVGVLIYRAFFPKSRSLGAGLKPELIHGVPVFVLPNPSGLNASYPGFAHKLVWFERLAAIAPPSRGRPKLKAHRDPPR